MSEIRPVERSDFHLRIVHEIGDLVNQSNDLDAILRGIVNKISDSLHFDVVSIYFWDGGGKELMLRATRGLRIDPANPIRLKPEEGLTGLVYETRRPLIVMPASYHPRYKYFPESGEEEYESYIGVPILIQNSCLGVLVGQTRERRLINPAEETLFQIIASRLAGLLEVADRLERLKAPSTEKQRTFTYQGKGVSGGFAVGTVYLSPSLFHEARADGLESKGVEEEIQRLTEGFASVGKDLDDLIQALEREGVLSESEINIFRAHLLILEDSGFRNPMIKRIKEKNIPAELAVVEEIEIIAHQFESHKEHYFRDRAQDFRDIGEKILYHLLGSRGRERAYSPPDGKKFILVSYEIGPYLLATIHNDRIVGIVTEKGGETSHASILARSLGIPAVVGIEDICSLVKSGETLLVDGKTGFVFLNPDQGLINECESTYRKLVRIKEVIEREGVDTESASIPITLTANVAFPLDVEMSKHYNLKDVGLFRTEFAFMRYDRWPTILDQVEIYESVARHFGGYVTIRTLDIGADKSLSYFSFPKEENPLLGLRSIRFSMEHLDLFRDQIKAILMTTKKGYRFRILLPMVSHVWEAETARDMIEQLGVEIGIPQSQLPPLGVMIEVPAIFYQLDDYKDIIDFVSLGTNDLIQYLLAVDRNSNVVGHLYSGFHPAVLRMLNEIFLRAESMGKEISICGEMAGTPSGALGLISLGYRQLSVLPSRAPVIRYLSRKIDEDLLCAVRSKILGERKEAEIRRYLIEALESVAPDLIEME